MSRPTPSIGIVGGGFSGAALAAHLLRDCASPLAIHLVEPRLELGWGLTYGNADAGHILNVTAGRMSLWQERSDDFLDWARANGRHLGWPQAQAATADTYLPRRLFGHYVQARLAEQRGTSCGLLEHHRSTVCRVRRQEDGFVLDLADGGHLFVGAVVLATGFAAPAVPFPVDDGISRFLADPWTAGALAQIGDDDAVLIVGTGLTMLDMVTSLARRGHRGGITALSRHGLLPRLHGGFSASAPLLSEADCAKGLSHALHRLRATIADGETDWRSAMESLRPVTDRLWQALTPIQQAQFSRHLHPWWEVHRHRMPADSADLLLGLVAGRRLRIEAGRIRQVAGRGDCLAVSVASPGDRNSQIREVDWVLNCTPPAPHWRPPFNPLYDELRSEGLARPDRTGLWFDLEADGSLIGADGKAVRGLFALGPLRLGGAKETTAVPHIRPQVLELSSRLVGMALAGDSARR